MKKSVFAKRVLTVVLAATMVLSNSSAAFAEAPSTPANDTVIVTETGDDETIESTEPVTDDTNAPTVGEEEKTGDDTAVTDPASEEPKAEEPAVATDVSEESGTITFTVPDTVADVDASALPDSDELLTGFLEKELKEQINENSMQVSTPLMRSTKRSALMGAVPRSQGMNLTGNDLVVYNLLKEQIEQVASGGYPKAIIEVPLSLLNDGRLSYTAEELGYSTVSDAVATFQNKYLFDLSKVVNALLADCPYSLYWFDKSQYSSVTRSGFNISGNATELWIEPGTIMTVSFMVSADYSATKRTGTYDVDTGLTSSASGAVAYAQSVVNTAVEKGYNTDYKKLVYYRDWIAGNVSYDDSANPNDNYGNPWQVIWVFDGDPSTNVVCEGYSKAFKWLCDLSAFDDSRTGCHVVAGDLYDERGYLGGHMWNIVRMDDGKYYMADITNYDGDGGVDEPILFLGSYSKYENGKYQFNLKYYDYFGYYVAYRYHNSTINQFSAEELAISSTSYTNLYTVSFDLNGHGEPISPMIGIEKGGYVTKPTDPKAAGYNFLGWFKDKGCTIAWNFDNDTVNGNTTLYAKWVAVQRTITFYSNNGQDETLTQTVLDSTATALNPNTFTKSGSSFMGWNTQADGSGDYYGNREAVSITSDMDLFAQWQEIPAGAPSIVSQPYENVDIRYDETAFLSLTATAQSDAEYVLSYQWYSKEKNDTEGTAIEGATSSSYSALADFVGTKYYYCVVTAERTDNHTKASTTSVVSTVNASKAIPVMDTLPEKNDNLIYSGTEQPLITTGTANDNEATVVYSLSMDGEFTSAAPKGLNAGNYIVYYKIEGNEHYEDTDVLGSVSVGIAKRPVTVTGGIKTNSKEYNRNTDAVLNCSDVVFAGVCEGDKLSITAKGTFADAHAGEEKTVYISDITLAGNGLGNYVLDPAGEHQSVTTGEITPKTLTVKSAEVDDKVYDGTADAKGLAHDVVLEGICPGDSVSAIPKSAAFNDRVAVENKPVVLEDWALTGSDSGNYTIDSDQQVRTYASITPKPVKIVTTDAVNISKEYDGTKTAQLATIANADQMYRIAGSDDSDETPIANVDIGHVEVQIGKGQFETADAGENIKVTFSDFALTGDDPLCYRNYEVVEQPAPVYGKIEPKGLQQDFVIKGTYIYNGEAQVPLVEPQGECTVLTPNDYKVVIADNCVGAGEYDCSVVQKEGSNYTFAPWDGTLEIQKATLYVKADNKSRRVGNSDPDWTYTVTGLRGNDEESIIDPDKIEWTCPANANSLAGEYVINLSYKDTLNNYDVVCEPGTLSVGNKDAITLTVELGDHEYNGRDDYYPTIEGVGNLSYEDLYASGKLTVTYKGTLRNGTVFAPTEDNPKPTEAGSYVVEVSYEDSEAIYYGVKEFSILPIDISSGAVGFTHTVVSNNAFEYGHFLVRVEMRYDGGNIVINDNPTWKITGHAPYEVGTHTLTITAPENGNFTGTASIEYTVEPVAVTVTGIKVSPREYDGTNEAVLDFSEVKVTKQNSTYVLNQGIVTVTATGTYDDANAGSDRTVTISNIQLSGDRANNLIVSVDDSQKTVTGCTITQKHITPTVTANGTYTYNGEKISPNVTVKDGSDILAETDYTVNGQCTNAGTANASVSCTATGNYSFTACNVDFTIEKAVVKVTGGISAADKDYNGTDSVTLNTSGATLEGVADRDKTEITVSAKGKFEDVNAGTNKKVIISEITLGTNNGHDYLLDNYRVATTGNQPDTTADISPKSITPSVSVSGTYTYTGYGITPEVVVWDNVSDRPLAAGDYEVTVSDNINAGTAAKVTVSPKTGGNYTFDANTAQFTINPASVTVKANDVRKKIGTVSPSDLTVTITGLCGNDTESKINCSVNLPSCSEIGEYVITPSGDTVQGNYYVTYVPGKLTIVGKDTATLSVTQTGTTYGGTALVDPDYMAPSGSCVSKTLSYTGTLRDGTSYDSNAKPSDAGDYTVTVRYETTDTIYTGSASFTIAPKDIAGATVTFDDASLEYDGSERFPTNIKVMLGTTDITGYCTIPTVGAVNAATYNFAASAKSSSNYTGSVSSSFTVTPKEVSISGGITVENGGKVYDGNTTAKMDCSGAAINGLVSGDGEKVSVTAKGTYSDANVGTKTVTVSDIRLTGENAGNYTLSSTTIDPVSAIISQKDLVVDGIAVNGKTYDGNATAKVLVAGMSVAGVVAGDEVNVSVTGAFADKNVGTAKTVTLSFGLNGAKSGNYKISDSTDKTAQANITAKSVTITGTSAKPKVYDGNRNAVINAAGTINGLCDGDDVQIDLGNATATFEDKNVGTGKTVTFDGFTLKGANADCYTLASQPASVTADITPKAVKVTGITAKDKTYDGKVNAELDLTNASIANKIDGDDLSVTAKGEFDNENAGSNKNVSLHTVTLIGKDAGNYTLASDSQSSATANINKADHDSVSAPAVEFNAVGLSGAKKIDIEQYIEGPGATVSFTFNDSVHNNYLETVNGDIYSIKRTDTELSDTSVVGTMMYTVSCNNYKAYVVKVPFGIYSKSAEVTLGTSNASDTGVTEVLAASDSFRRFVGAQEEGQVSTTLEVTPKTGDEVENEDTAGATELQKAIDEKFSGVPANKVTADNLDISIIKKAQSSPSDAVTETKITDTGRVLSTTIKYNLLGRYNPKMFTLHDGVVKQLTQLFSMPNEEKLDNCDGCFYVEGNGKDAKITIYSSKYSIYTIVTSSVPVYEVKLDDTLGKVVNLEIAENSKITKPSDPVKDGYTFDGWFDASGKAWNFSNLVTSSVVLTAKFTKKATSTVVVQPTDSSETTQQSSEGTSDSTKQEETPAQSTAARAKATASNTSNSNTTVTDTKTETVTETKEETVVEPVVADTTEAVETVEEIKEEVTDTKEATKESEPAKEPEIAKPEKEKKFPGGLVAGLLGGAALLAAAAYIFIKKKP